MDEMNKGIRTFRVLRKNVLPTGFDSLIQTSAADAQTSAAILAVAAIEDVALVDLTLGAASVLNAGGIDRLQYVGTHLDADGADSTLDCAGTDAANPSPEEIIASRANAVVAGNIFMSPAANGCGYTVQFDEDGEIVGGTTGDLAKVAVWTGGFERVMGVAGTGFDTDLASKVGAPVLMAVGLGPSSNLFNANDLGGMTTVPVYRHVSGVQYNRFVALFNIGTYSAAWTAGATATDPDVPGAYTSGGQVTLTAIVDGAGDTKEEELGEWDGTRNTI